jgi:hypothetical protein
MFGTIGKKAGSQCGIMRVLRTDGSVEQSISFDQTEPEVVTGATS